MEAIEPQQWVAALGAVGTLVLLARVILRYERLFIADSNDEIKTLRADILDLRARVTAAEAETAECMRARAQDRREMDNLHHEIARLRAAMGGTIEP